VKASFLKFKEQFSFSKEGLSFTEKFILCLPLQALSLSNVLIHNVYIKFYTDLVGLKPSYVSLIYFIFNVWNMLNDPVFGVFLDKMKYKPKRGKYTYVMRVTVPFMVIMLIIMLFASPSWEDITIFWVLLVALFLYDTAGTFFLISANCYTMLAAPTKEERIDVSVIGGYVGNFVSFFATLIPTMLLVGSTKNNRSLVIGLLLFVVLMNTGIYLIGIIKLKDKPEMYAVGDSSTVAINTKTLWIDIKSVITMRSFWCNFFFNSTGFAPQAIYFTAFLYYMDYVVKSTGFEATLADVLPMVAVFLIYPILGNIIKKKGIKKSLFLAMIPYIIGYLILYFSNTWYFVLIAYIPIMLGRTISLTSRTPLTAAIIDENELKTSIRKPGLFNSINAILTAPIAGLQLIIFTTIIENYGFQPGGVAQTSQAVQGIRIATALVPIGFCLLGIIPLILLPFNLEKEKILSAFSKERRQLKNVSNL